jgi:hypothetical protein
MGLQLAKIQSAHLDAPRLGFNLGLSVRVQLGGTTIRVSARFDLQ